MHFPITRPSIDSTMSMLLIYGVRFMNSIDWRRRRGLDGVPLWRCRITQAYSHAITVEFTTMDTALCRSLLFTMARSCDLKGVPVRREPCIVAGISVQYGVEDEHLTQEPRDLDTAQLHMPTKVIKNINPGYKSVRPTAISQPKCSSLEPHHTKTIVSIIFKLTI